MSKNSGRLVLIVLLQPSFGRCYHLMFPEEFHYAAYPTIERQCTKRLYFESKMLTIRTKAPSLLHSPFNVSTWNSFPYRSVSISTSLMALLRALYSVLCSGQSLRYISLSVTQSATGNSIKLFFDFIFLMDFAELLFLFKFSFVVDVETMERLSFVVMCGGGVKCTSLFSGM